MIKIIKIFASIISILILAGCGAISTVQDGHLKENKTQTIGEAFDSYRYFKSAKWSTGEAANGDKLVLAECEIDLDKDPQGANFKKMAKEVFVIFEFTIKQDNSFEPTSMSGKLVTLSGETKMKVMPTVPSWMLPRQVLLERLYQKQTFTDIILQIITHVGAK